LGIVGSWAAMATLSVRFRTASVRSGAAKKAILCAGFRTRTASVRSGVTKRAVGVRSEAVEKALRFTGFSTASVRSGVTKKAVGVRSDAVEKAIRFAGTASVTSGRRAVKRGILSVGDGFSAGTRSAGSGVANKAILSVGFSAVNRDIRSAGSGAANKAMAANRGTPSVGFGAVITTPAKPGATAARVRKSY
jgi:hypothetical protein